MNKGIIYAGSAYLLWGFFPAFWKLLGSVKPVETLGHRIVWALAFLVIVHVFKRDRYWLRKALEEPRTLLPYLGTACLLALNWFTYVWAVNNDFIIETSLGYFINPLVNVLLGVLFLHERVRIWQWLALFIAASGVIWLTVSYGALPWIALTLAFTFGFYGLVRKTASLDSLQGLSVEMAVLFIPALVLLVYLGSVGSASFLRGGVAISILLALAGVVTAVPLLFFAAGARKIKLITLGVLQYIAPSLQFVLGAFVYHEPIGQGRLVGFGIIWLALLLYTAEGVWSVRKRATAAIVS